MPTFGQDEVGDILAKAAQVLGDSAGTLEGERQEVEKLGEKRARRIEREAQAQLAKEHLEANLRAVREMAGKTQVELAREAGVSQAELSRNKSAGDHLVSTLRRYVEALGGELETRPSSCAACDGSGLDR